LLNSSLCTTLIALAATATLAACGGGTTAADPVAVAATPAAKAVAAPVRGTLGTVTAITPQYSKESTSGVGAVLGTVVGAAAGHQIGGGDGKKLATAVGAVGGAFAGNKIEKDRNSKLTGYLVEVRLDNGQTSAYTLSQAGSFTNGQRVRVLDGQIKPA
jgi:outer membrane lipoprotein SlyB